MGKWTDKLYITQREWATQYGGAKRKSTHSTFIAHPFNHCCLTLSPADQPVLSPCGHFFNLPTLLPYLATHHTCPVDGLPLKASSLIALHLGLGDGWRCPVTGRSLGDGSTIMVNRLDGRVYSQEGLATLVKGEGYEDLDGSCFGVKDLIVMHDPGKPKNVADFVHVRRRKEAAEGTKLEMKGKVVKEEGEHFPANEPVVASKNTKVDPTIVVKKARTTSNTPSTIGRYMAKK